MRVLVVVAASVVDAALAGEEDGDDDAGDMPDPPPPPHEEVSATIFARVTGPTVPTGLMLLALWNAVTAACVSAP
jgi:hypothetical protein